MNKTTKHRVSHGSPPCFADLCPLTSDPLPRPTQLLDWHLQLDRALPAPLGQVGVWLHRAEEVLRQDVPPAHQAQEQTASTVHRALEQHKVSPELHSTEGVSLTGNPGRER